MGQHGPQCICEICTCGRHQCPFDRHKNQTGLSLGEEGEGGGGGHFYRKEFATVENGGQRTRPTRPKGELTLNDAPFSAGRNDNELRPALASGGDARNERFVTSAALRKRAQNSQIELGNSTGGMRSTYREESERALQNGGAERSRPSRPTASTQLFQNEAETPKTTIHRTEFGAKRSEKVQATRPRTSDLWKRDGTVEGTTTTREQFAEKRPERNQPFRPKENAPILGDGDRAFQRETSNLSEYGPKKAEKQGGRRPPDSDLFKSGEPLLERATVNRSEYGQGGRGERFERTVRANEGAELLRGDGTFAGETSKNAEFQPKRGDRFEAKVQGSSDIWKSGDRLEGRGVNRVEYGREGRGDRFPAHRPMESGILKGEGSFATETLKRVEFGPKQGQRAEAARPRTSDLWKQNQSQPMANGQTTVTRSEYRGGRGERFEMRKPADSDILRAQGKFNAESVAHSEFGEKGAGERFAARRPGTNEVWRREGRMAENGSVNRVEYTIEGKRGERHEMRRPKDEPLFDPDIDPSQPPLSTVHRTEFVQRQGERAARSVRTDEGAELLRGDGSFLSETSKNAEFQPKRGDRFEAKVQGSSDIWKTEGKMDGQTVNRDEYRQMKGERAEARRPEKSGILRGEGSFATETHKRVEFGPKQGQRAEAARPADSELFRREGKIGTEGSVNRTDYSHTQGETAERRIQKESGILMPTEGSEFARSTVHRDDYNEKIREGVHPHRPTQSWRLEGPQTDFNTVTREDYVEKRLEAGEHSPVRRRGNESSFGLADELENAEFGRTMTQDEFGVKELGERSRPVVHHSELSITEPRATFHSSTMYSDNFQQISPDSYGTRTKVRPSTALKLSGDRELSSGYQMEYTNKIMPCPAGELMDSLKNHQCEEAPKEHPHTDNFEFHSVNKGHHLYRSRENLAEN